MKLENNHMLSNLSTEIVTSFSVVFVFFFFSIQLAEKIAQVFESNRFFTKAISGSNRSLIS